METVTQFILLGSKITADGDCSHEIKRCLLLRRKVMRNLESILKSRDINLPTKVCAVKAMVFPVVMYVYESWTIKKAEHWRNDAFELWCWRRLLRDPWTARRSNQSILKKISPGYSLEGLMLKLKLQYFGHLMQKTDSFEKTLMLGKFDSVRRRGWQRMRSWMAPLTQWIWVWVNSGIWWRTVRPRVLQSMGSQRVGHNWATELNWLTFLRKKLDLFTLAQKENKWVSTIRLISVLTIIWKIKLRQENIYLCERESVKKGGKSHIIYFCSFDPLSIPWIL